MLKHQPITATLSAKSFLAKRLLALVTEAPGRFPTFGICSLYVTVDDRTRCQSMREYVTYVHSYGEETAKMADVQYVLRNENVYAKSFA